MLRYILRSIFDIFFSKELDRARTTLEEYDDVKLLKSVALALLEEKICEKNKKDLQTVELRAINRDLKNEKVEILCSIVD